MSDPLRLPPLVRRYLERALPAGTGAQAGAGPGVAPAQLRLTQRGDMRKAPDARPQRFTATQHVAVDRVAFTWRARFPLVFPFRIIATDRYAGGAGHLEVRLLGRVMDRQEGAQTSVGEALRYLAELPWAPFAMRDNPELSWREVADDAVEVSTTLEGHAFVVRLDFDASGDVVRASSTMRPRDSDQGWMTMPWGGEYSDYATFDGIRVPTRAEVYWEPPEGRFVYWRATVTSVTALAEPFADGPGQSTVSR